jgi:hypothetical protein
MEKIQFIQITPDELKDAIINGVRKELEKLKKDFQPKDPEQFLTRNEVADMLKINISTVHNWTKEGTLIRHQIAGRVYYKRTEIEKSIVPLKK